MQSLSIEEGVAKPQSARAVNPLFVLVYLQRLETNKITVLGFGAEVRAKLAL